jgi:hypothetical protein
MREREKLNLTVDDKTREFLEDACEATKVSKSKIVDTLIQLCKDAVLDSDQIKVANYIRKRIGKKPLKNTNRFYRDIWSDK